MWQPEPGWQRLPGGTGPSTVGVWRAVLGERPVAVKRLAAPAEHDPAGADRPPALRLLAAGRRRGHVRHRGRRRRGLRSPLDASGSRRTSTASPSSTTGSRTPPTAGLFAAPRHGPVRRRRPRRTPPWLARDQLRDRLARVERRGGWQTLARTTVADVADHLWRRRERSWTRSTRSPRCPSTATRCRANLPGREADEVVAIDWGTLGHGPVGADLGYYALSAREEFEPLLDAYLDRAPRRPGHPRRGRARRPGHRRLHRR